MPELRPNRTLGPGHDEFWRHCAADELRLQRCTACGAWQWPVVSACEACGCRDLRFEAVSGDGKIAGWTTFERDYYGGMLPMPWDTILVDLDEGVLFMANPLGFGWRDTQIGMAVKLAFVDCEDDAGAFQLPVFERAG